MKNIISLGLAVVMGLGVLAHAAPKVKGPNDKRGDQIHSDPYSGWSYFTETDATESLVCSGKCLLGGFYRSTGATTSHVEVRDTGAIGGDNTLFMFPRHFFRVVETDYTNRNPMEGRSIYADNGIAIKLSSVGAGETVTVLYLDLDD